MDLSFLKHKDNLSFSQQCPGSYVTVFIWNYCMLFAVRSRATEHWFWKNIFSPLISIVLWRQEHQISPIWGKPNSNSLYSYIPSGDKWVVIWVNWSLCPLVELPVTPCTEALLFTSLLEYFGVSHTETTVSADFSWKRVPRHASFKPHRTDYHHRLTFFSFCC